MSEQHKFCPQCGGVVHTKSYVGGEGTYGECRDCGLLFGGEEGPRKRALLQAAAEQDPGEQGEVEGAIE